MVATQKILIASASAVLILGIVLLILHSLRKSVTPEPEMLYAIGGNNLPRKDGERFDPAANSWSPIASMSMPRTGAAGAVIDGKLYAVGGYKEKEFLNSVERYDPVADQWDPTETVAPMTTARANSGAVVLAGKLYVIGGTKGHLGALDTVECYDPTLNKWKVMPSMNSIREGPAAAVVDGLLYAIGGTNTDGVETNSVERYDPNEETWKTIKNMNTGRGYCAAAVIDGKIYVVGGFNYREQNLTEALQSVECYDPKNSRWEMVEPMKIARYGHGVAVSDGLLYAVSGDAGEDSWTSGERYDPTTNKWSPIESLTVGRPNLTLVSL